MLLHTICILIFIFVFHFHFFRLFQRLLFDGSLYLLTLLSNVAEANEQYALKLANFNIETSLEECSLREFCTTAAPLRSSLFAPHLLLSIINTETKGFLREIEKADLELKYRAEAHTQALLLPDNLTVNAGSNVTSPQKHVTGSTDNTKNSPKSVFENSVSEPNEERRMEVSKETSPNKSKNIVRESEEIVEQLPVAELILASHASLLLYTVCTCLPVLTESGDRADCTMSQQLSPHFNQILDDDNGKSRKSSGSKGNIKTRINETSDVSVPAVGLHSTSSDVAVTRTHVRTALPQGTWWLPIRVLKGFLVLQGQVRTLHAVRTVCSFVDVHSI